MLGIRPIFPLLISFTPCFCPPCLFSFSCVALLSGALLSWKIRGKMTYFQHVSCPRVQTIGGSLATAITMTPRSIMSALTMPISYHAWTLACLLFDTSCIPRFTTLAFDSPFFAFYYSNCCCIIIFCKYFIFFPFFIQFFAFCILLYIFFL